MELIELAEDQRFLDYNERCFNDIIESGRGKRYIEILVMMAHIGRIPEFDESSYDKFLHEAMHQNFSAMQWERALGMIADTSGPGDLLPNAASAWEFLALATDFVQRYAELKGFEEQLATALERVGCMSTMAFFVALNAELGIRKDFW